MPKPWYEALYENFENYDEEPYTKATTAEIDFIDAELGSDRTKRILDVGCGTGRHSLELARRGYTVTGLDLSEELLQLGMHTARQEGLAVEFVHGDARRLQYVTEFDGVLILCEGGFSLVETDEMDRRILAEAGRALRPGGRLFITAPNAVFMIAQQPDNPDFDLATFRESFTIEAQGANSQKRTLDCTQRYYTAPELKATLQEIGFEGFRLFAVNDKGYEHSETISKEDFEFGMVAIKR
jgi:SAM-dependent methyltransferase